MSLIINHINKIYKSGLFGNVKFIALSDINFSLETGHVLALIGQNGAGKTTLIKCILGFIRPNSGNISMDDNTILNIIRQGQLGYMPEMLKYEGLITFNEYIRDLMVLRGKNMSDYQERYISLLDKFHMHKHMNKLLTQYSKGTMKKATFIQAILHNPNLLILDEPTDGLDPISRRVLLNEVLEIKRNGGTVIITTHLLSDLSIVADKIVVLQNGKLISQSEMKNIHESLDDWYLQTITQQGGLDEI